MNRIETFHDETRARFRKDLTLRIARRVLRLEGKRDLQIRIIFTGDRSMKVLNNRFLGRSYATDVISFPLDGPAGNHTEAEVYVNLEQARRQASQEGVSNRNEVARLVVHGLLHVLGYDDASRRQRNRMTRRENEILQDLKIA